MKSGLFKLLFLTVLILTAAFTAIDAAYATDITSPVINNLEIQDANAINAQGEMTVKLDITEEGVGVSNIWMVFCSDDPDNPGWEQFPTVSVAIFDVNREGQSIRSLFTGSHVISIPLTSQSVSEEFRNGNYYLYSVSIMDNDRNSIGYYGAQVSDICANRDVVLFNSRAADSTPPILNALTIHDPDNVDATQGIPATVDITEDGSGVSYIALQLRDEEGKTYHAAVWYDESKALYTGKHDVLIRITDTISKTGKYQIEYAYVVDQTGNQRMLSNHEKITGTELYLTKVAEVIQHTTKLNKVSLKQHNIEAPNVLDIDCDLYDSDEGVKIVLFNFKNKDDNGKPLYVEWSCWTDGDGTYLSSGEHSFKFTVSPFVPPGEYVLDEVSVLGSGSMKYSASQQTGEDIPIVGGLDLTITSPFVVSYFGSIENSAALGHIKDMENDGIAVIDCRRSKKVTKDYFQAIMNTNKTIVFEDENVQWVFHGQSINESGCKDIDLETHIYTASGTEQGFADDENVLVIQFADNGQLPGEAEIRVNNAYISAKYKTGNSRLILSYVNDAITVEDENVSIEADEAAILGINHNSTFVLSQRMPRENIPTNNEEGGETPVKDDSQSESGSNESPIESGNGNSQVNPGTTESIPTTVKSGDIFNVDGNKYIVTSLKNNTVAFIAAKNKKSVTVPDIVTINGNPYKVTMIKSKAFKRSKATSITTGKNILKMEPKAFGGSKVKTLTIKSKKLKKESVKGSLKGSQVKTVKVKVGNKKMNKKYAKKYRKIFTKKNAGKKVTVK